MADATGKPEGGFGGGRASAADAAELAGHLATLTRSGLPLPEGLRAVGAELGSSGTVSAILGRTADRLDRGEPLGEALAAEGGRFPGPIRALVEAGVRTGRMPDLLAEFVRHATLGQELRQAVWGAISYPLFLLVVLGGVIIVASTMATRASSTILNVMRDFGISSIAQNELILGVAAWLSDWGLLTLVGLFAGAVLGTLVGAVTLGRGTQRRFVTGLPLVGPLLRWSAMAEFCHILALLIDAEVPLPEALRLAGGSVHDADLAEHCDGMAALVEEGHPLSIAVRAWPAIPAGLGQVFNWGEDRGSLAESLHLAGDLFEARARTQGRYTNTVFLALLLLLIANGLAFAVLLLAQPIQLISRLSGTLLAPWF